MKLKRLLLLLVLGLMTLVMSHGQERDDDDDDDEEVKESQLVGVERALDDETYMGLAIEGNALVLRFYDEEKQLTEPEAERASAWWKPVNRSGRERVVLNPSGDGLRSPPKVHPPYVFYVMVTLIDDEGEAIGTHRFDMSEL